MRLIIETHLVDDEGSTERIQLDNRSARDESCRGQGPACRSAAASGQ